MYFNKKLYKIKHAKSYFKNFGLIFFTSSLNKGYENSILNKAELSKLKFNSKKIVNKILLNLVDSAVFKEFHFLMSSSLQLIMCNTKVLTKSMVTSLSSILLVGLAFKLNDKIYSKALLNNCFSFNYYQNKCFIKQVCAMSLKKFNKIK